MKKKRVDQQEYYNSQRLKKGEKKGANRKKTMGKQG